MSGGRLQKEEWSSQREGEPVLATAKVPNIMPRWGSRCGNGRSESGQGPSTWQRQGHSSPQIFCRVLTKSFIEKRICLNWQIWILLPTIIKEHVPGLSHPYSLLVPIIQFQTDTPWPGSIRIITLRRLILSYTPKLRNPMQTKLIRPGMATTSKHPKPNARLLQFNM